MNQIIGIDLGTTYSVASFIENGKPRIIASREGGNLIPSVVAFTEKGSRLVGKIARTQAAANPERTIVSIKRWMGSDKRIEIDGKAYSPQEISGFILGKVKKEAEAYLSRKIKKAVITVPAYFDDNQRQATMEAGLLAGLEVLRIINEPTAASLAYGLDKEDIHFVLVWDLGGGTFDVSILELGEGVFEVRAVNGDTHLGGDDWDQKIIDHLAEEFKEKNKIDLRENKTALQRLREASEKAKIRLSENPSFCMRIPFIVPGKDLEAQLSREMFEEISKDLLERLIAPTRQALKDARLKAQDIDRVILVGGSTRMAAIQRLAKELFGQDPYEGINPDEAVAVGAAIQAAILSGEIQQVTLVDILPLSVGIETMGGIFTRIIERNTPIPVSRSQIFTTAQDNQSQVDIHILQGERALAVDNISLGKFALENIPLARRGEPQIEVTFHVDTNGILQVSALDLLMENQRSIKLDSYTRLSQERINEMLKEAEVHAEDDERMKEHIQVGIRAESMIAGAQLVMENWAEAVDRSRIDEIERAILKVKKTLAQGGDEETKLETQKLRDLIKASADDVKRRESVGNHYLKRESIP